MRYEIKEGAGDPSSSIDDTPLTSCRVLNVYVVNFKIDILVCALVENPDVFNISQMVHHNCFNPDCFNKHKTTFWLLGLFD